MTADRAKRREQARVGPAPNGARSHREQLSDLRWRQDLSVAVVRFTDERGQRLRLPLPLSRFLGYALCRESLPEGGNIAAGLSGERACTSSSNAPTASPGAPLVFVRRGAALA